MTIVGDTLDDVLRDLYPRLLGSSRTVETTRGRTYEIVGTLVEILRPRARLSRTETRGKAFTCLGELMWYLSRDNKLDLIAHYIPEYEKESEDKITVYGGYGPRLFRQRGLDQIDQILDLLRRKPNSRRAVVQIFNAEDIEQHRREIPCTTTLQFLARDGKLHMLTTMRSNDAFIGLPHDVFCFTMLQEIVARTLDFEIGTYKHFVGSMHFYEDSAERVQAYLDEGIQPTIEMPPMPLGDPWPSLRTVVDAERRIREGQDLDADGLCLDQYWADLVRLLQIYSATGDTDRVETLMKNMIFPKYAVYIRNRVNMARRTPRLPSEPSLKI